MSEQPPICPKCHGEMTGLQTGLKCCPACGFAGDKEKVDTTLPSRRSQTLFWIALVAPATLALVSFLLGRSPGNMRDAGVAVGLGGLVVGLWASVYCAVWVVRRFCPRDSTRILLGLVLFVAIGLVNFIIICAGCAANLTSAASVFNPCFEADACRNLSHR